MKSRSSHVNINYTLNRHKWVLLWTTLWLIAIIVAQVAFGLR